MEKEEEIAIAMMDYKDRIVVDVINSASKSDLNDLQKLISKRKKEIGR